MRISQIYEGLTGTSRIVSRISRNPLVHASKRTRESAFVRVLQRVEERRRGGGGEGG